MTNSKAKRKSERTVFTYVVLRDASEHALFRARERNEGFFLECMTTILFSAFCFEAYLNHLGPIYVPYWKLIDRKLGPREKLEIISDHIKFPLDFGKRPFQSFLDINKYRNWLVHGRTAKIISELEVNDISEKGIPEMELTKWEKITTLENAEKLFEDTGTMIKALDKSAGFDRDPFFTQYQTFWENIPLDK
jgi:hypothetical protein